MKVQSSGESRYRLRPIVDDFNDRMKVSWSSWEEDRCSIHMVIERCVVSLRYCHKWENAASHTLQRVLKIQKCLLLIHLSQFKLV